MSLNVTTPIALEESTQKSIQSAAETFRGLGATLYGPGSLLEGTPLGAVWKQASTGELSTFDQALGAVAAATNPAGALGLTLGVLDKLGTQVSSPGSQANQRVEQLFAELPASVEKEALLSEVATKSYGEQMSAKYQYLREQARIANQTAETPALNPGVLEVPPPTLSDAVKFLLVDTIPLVTKPIEAEAAGVKRGTTGADQMTRLEEIAAYERGEFEEGFFTGPEAVTPMERIALDNFRSGFWSEQEANRYLASADAGFAHDPGIEMVSQIASDPTVWASLGAAGVAGGGARAALTAETRAALGKAPGWVGRYGAFYSADAGIAGAVGKSAKVARYVIDPLHGIGGHANRPDPYVDAYARIAGGQMARVHGELAYRQALDFGTELGHGSQLLQDIAAFEGIQARATVLEMQRSAHNQFDRLWEMMNPDFTPASVVDPLTSKAPLQKTGDAMAARMGRYRIVKWTDAENEMLARRVEQLYPGTPGAVPALATEWTPRAPVRAPKGMYTHTTANGGGTFDVATGRELGQTSGYGVGNGPLGKIVPNDRAAVNAAYREVSASGTPQIGTWLNPEDGMVYVDPTQVVDDLQEALALASSRGEKAIYDFANQVDIPVPRTPGRVDIAKRIAGMSDDEKNILHGATRAGAVRKVVEARAAAIANGEWRHAVAPERLNLMNADTLDTLTAKLLADDFEERLTVARAAYNAGDGEAAAAAEREVFDLARDAQQSYPEALGRVRLDTSRPASSVERMRSYLEHLREEGMLPTMVEAHDLPEMGYDITRVNGWLAGTSAEGQRGAWKLGFMPEQDKRWAVIYDSAGDPMPAGAVWDDLIAPDNVRAYMPWTRKGFNVAGHEVSIGSIPGLGRALDGVEGGMRTMTKRVSTSQIHEAAKVRFVGQLRVSGFTEGEARAVFTRLNEVAGLHKVTVRGMSAQSMWDAVEEVIPARLRVPGLGYNRRQLVLDMLDAYGGDMRFVGLTQKFTGAMKRASARMTGGNVEGANFLGQFSEDTFGKLRFKWNPGFQLQERVESPFWSFLRGVKVKVGSKLTPEERLYQARLDRQLETSSSYAGDLADQYAYAASTLGWSRGASDILRQKMPPEVLTGALNTYGNKQVNLLRTHAKGLGERFRKLSEDIEPGYWDDLKAVQIRRLGRSVTDDELATMMMTENLFASDVQVNRLVAAGADNVEYLKAMREQAAFIQQNMAAPVDLGNMVSLELQRIVELTRPYTKEGDLITSVSQFMGAIKRDPSLWSDLDNGMRAALEHAGFHESQIIRIENALKFDWQDFWSMVRETYQLDNAMLARLQSMMSGAARTRGLSGSEFMSSFFAPTVERGSQGAVEAMGGMVRFLQPVADEAADAGVRLESLVGQMADTFIDYMDPSMMRQLGVEFLDDASTISFRDASVAQLMEVMRGGTPERERLAAIIKDSFLRRVSREATEELPDELETWVYTARYPDQPGRQVVDEATGQYTTTSRSVGPGLVSAEERIQRPIMAAISDLRSDFPDVPFLNIDIRPIHLKLGKGGLATETDATLFEGAFAATQGYQSGDTAIFLAKKFYNDRKMAERWEQATRLSRPAVRGGPLDGGPIGTVYHEFGHALDGWLRAGPGGLTHPGAQTYRSWVYRFRTKTRVIKDLQAGLISNGGETLGTGDAEAVAELFMAAFDPAFDRSVLKPETLRWVDDFSDMLRDIGVLKPGSAKPYSQGLDATHQYFAEWMRGTLSEGLQGGADAARSEFLLRSIVGIPNDMAVPFNLTESLLMRAFAAESMRKFDNAFKLHYFDRNRRVWERSLNHQVFGVYPASYMWGKVAPELIRFIGYEPFGVRTGAMAYGLMDVQRAVLNQREFDPEFDKKVEQLGAHPAISFMGYLMPAPAQDVVAALPGWMRAIAEQGLENEQRAALGIETKDIDIVGTALSSAGDLLNPLRGEERFKDITDYIVGAVSGTINPATGREYTEQELLEQEAGMTTATELPQTLFVQQQQLEDILSGR